jgi:hypothetical protein
MAPPRAKKKSLGIPLDGRKNNNHLILSPVGTTRTRLGGGGGSVAGGGLRRASSIGGGATRAMGGNAWPVTRVRNKLREFQPETY